ncbi:YqcC family protein [Gallaecimonas sp. GXIMD4217]|uniref:YqcC family protein n=1 Tax=Gallaecimonas sp. GXIMD4217 TaxID=3131927 RepID=UPI00311ACAA3
MSQRIVTVLAKLEAIEMEMQVQGLWSDEEPAEEALASTQPFCVDTLAFEQWVQFVMLPKLKVMVQQGQAPSNISVCPMAEESWKEHGERLDPLLDLFADVDELLSGKRVRDKNG